MYPPSSAIVPSRSRKTAGRGRNCSGTPHPDRRQPGACCGFDHVDGDCRHAPVIGGAAAKKTRAAIRLLLSDAAAWGDGSCSLWIGGTKHRDDGQANGGGTVHLAGIIPL